MSAKNLEGYVLRMEFADRHHLANKIPIEKLSAIIKNIYESIGVRVEKLGGRASALDIGDLIITIPGDISRKKAEQIIDCIRLSNEDTSKFLLGYKNPEKTGLHVGIAYGQVVVSDAEGNLSAIGIPVLKATGAMKVAEQNDLPIVADALVGKTLVWDEFPIDSGVAKSHELGSAFRMP